MKKTLESQTSQSTVSLKACIANCLGHVSYHNHFTDNATTIPPPTSSHSTTNPNSTAIAPGLCRRIRSLQYLKLQSTSIHEFCEIAGNYPTRFPFYEHRVSRREIHNSKIDLKLSWRVVMSRLHFSEFMTRIFLCITPKSMPHDVIALILATLFAWE